MEAELDKDIVVLSGDALLHMNGVTWWACPHCRRMVHANIVNGDGRLLRGHDSACDPPGCPVRHCISWEKTPPTVYTYNPRTCDYSKLPYIAQLL